jgi:hypothetical protein
VYFFCEKRRLWDIFKGESEEIVGLNSGCGGMCVDRDDSKDI